MIKQNHHAIFVLPSGHDLVSFPSSQVSLNHPYLKKMKITLGMNKAVIVGPPLSGLISCIQIYFIIAIIDAFKKTRLLMDR